MRTYQVDGMTCEGCVKSVRKALERQGLTAQVDLGKGLVTVDGEPDDAAVLAAIDRAGFDARKAS
jgi:copper chaperone